MTDPQERPCPRLYPHPPHKHMHQRRSVPCPGVREDADDLYFCPTVGEIESKSSIGGGTCCAQPEQHTYLGRSTPGIQAISSWLSEKAKDDYARAQKQAQPRTWADTVHTDDDGRLIIPVYAEGGTERDAVKVGPQDAILLHSMIGDYVHDRLGNVGELDSLVERVTQAVARNFLDSVGMEDQPLPDETHPMWSGWREDAKAAIEAVVNASEVKP